MNKTLSRTDFPHFCTISLRWHDNDIYGHVNNVVYYSFFDSAVNQYLIQKCGVDIHDGDIIAFVVNSSCQYFIPIAYPGNIQIGVRVSKLGTSSVSYELGVFSDDDPQLQALGIFVHVFVARESGQSTPIPTSIKEHLQCLLAEP